MPVEQSVSMVLENIEKMAILMYLRKYSRMLRVLASAIMYKRSIHISSMTHVHLYESLSLCSEVFKALTTKVFFRKLGKPNILLSVYNHPI